MKIKTFVLWLAAFVPAALLGQDLTGTWQGTLQAGRDLRLVLKISKAEGGALKAVFYSIDQNPQPMSTNGVAVQGSTVKISVGGIGGTYEGKVSADGNSMAGTWTQGAKPLPLDLKRATAETAWVIPEPPKPLKPMAADANPVFEVATIKPSKPDRPGRAITMNGVNFATINTTLGDLIAFAYGVHAKQIISGPAWLETEKYDLSARPEAEGMPNQKQLKTMVQKLLGDRFKLSFHRDKKELSVYAITVAKGGPKLAKSEADPNGLPGLFFRGRGVLPARNANMGDLASVLQGAVLDRPVVDQTGLSGKFDFTLTWTPDQFQFPGFPAGPPAAENPDAPPDLFTAMQQQLGLKLESTKAPAEVLVIDRVEKPSEN
jgi:uncharacterized protein (TIGR03435 family)